MLVQYQQHHYNMDKIILLKAEVFDIIMKIRELEMLHNNKLAEISALLQKQDTRGIEEYESNPDIKTEDN